MPRSFRRLAIRMLKCAACLAACLIVAFVGLWVLNPFQKSALYDIPKATVWCDREGAPMRIQLAAGGFDSRPNYEYSADDWIAKAVVAAEDQRFWDHCGVDALAVARSLKQTVSSMRRVSGASTISMQVLRLTYPNKRNLKTKVVEAFRALQMERQVSKPEILALYLNRAPFGANLIGIEAAARRYFAKGAHDLSLGEASLLAGIPQSPTRFNPVKDLAAAKKRQIYVLKRMVACSLISNEQMANAIDQHLQFQANCYPFRAPHFCDVLTRSSHGNVGEIITTLDPAMQRAVEDALLKSYPTLSAQGIRGGAVVVLDTKTSEIRAMVGSPDFRAKAKGSQVNAATSPRSAGSTLKPFAYALAMERGMITPMRILFDLPQAYSDYDPKNFDEGYCGVVTARDALIRSLNMPAIDIEKRIGQPLLHAKLKELGLKSITGPPEHYGLGLVLGNAEVTLIDLANAYACIARGGTYLPHKSIPSAASPRVEIFSEEVSWLISDMLGGDERAMDSSGTIADIRIPKLAWKTGTSSGFRDAWTVAYNPDYVIGVWLGNPSGRSSSFLVGKKVAAPLVWEICRQIYPSGNGPWFQKPSAIETRDICADSGQAASRHCGRIIQDFGIKNVSRYESCEVHRSGPEAVWPAAVESFIQAQRATDSSTDDDQLVITAPANGSTFLHLPSYSQSQHQRIPFTAKFSQASADLHWFVNDHFVGTSKSGGTLFWTLTKGQHHIVCADPSGHSREVQISVR